MRIIRDDFTPELCIVILFDSSAIPVMVFGLTGQIDPYLISGFSQGVSSFINYISTYFPDISEEKAVINNFINSGFYYRKFKNNTNQKDYTFIIRPIYNQLFFEDWISKLLNEIVKELEDADDIEKISNELFQGFNARLFQEITLMDYIGEQEKKEKTSFDLLFRDSGVHVGELEDIKMEKIINMIVNHFDVSEYKLNLDGMIYHIKKKDLNGTKYYLLNKYSDS
ncbi:MAG: hypothetical protein GF329_02165 [Candidatus Lokiarchaeota archaeon]|nr:hypothetical protein [Candidatus Lokiarchaeota archaeon]